MSDIEMLATFMGLVIGFVIVRALLLFKRSNASASARPDASVGREDDTDSAQETQHASGSVNDDPAPPQFRVFSCPSCSQRIRVAIPLPGRTSRCSRCRSIFHVTLDGSGNLYVESGHTRGTDGDGDCGPSTVEDCLALLGLGPIATSEEIKSAYRRRMKEYHPDKVAHLGEKLRSVATIETQKLNSAYEFLKEKGYLSDV